MTVTPGKITEEMLARERARIGEEREERRFNYVATKDAIRHFAEGLGDANPLWQDEEYAKKTRWGGIIAPPCFLYSVAVGGAGGGLPGLHGLWSGDDWELFLPVRVDDSVTVTSKLLEVLEKGGEFTGKTVHRISETAYRNQRGEVVARKKHYQINFERQVAEQSSKYAGMGRACYTPEEIKAIEADYDREEIRGANPRYWEDVQIGEELTPVVKGPLTITDVIAWKIGFGSHPYVRAHSLALAYRRRHPAVAVVDAETGIPDVPERVHWENEMAHRIGMPGAYDYGPQRVSWLSHLMTNWMGDDGFLRRLAVQVRRPNFIGYTMWCKGKVTNKFVKDGDYLVECEIWAENQRGEITAPGHATVRLPSRGAGGKQEPRRTAG